MKARVLLHQGDLLLRLNAEQYSGTELEKKRESVWQAVTAKSPSSFESWSNRLLILASYKSSMVRLEKEWANLVKR